MLKVQVRELQARVRRPEAEKSDGVLCRGAAARLDWIHGHRGQFGIGLMCRVLGVSRSGYYARYRGGVTNSDAFDDDSLEDVIYPAR